MEWEAKEENIIIGFVYFGYWLRPGPDKSSAYGKLFQAARWREAR
jgi:hypothetical protein